MNTLVTAKINPDIDGVACVLAYTHLLRSQGRDVSVGIFGTPQEEVNYFIKSHKVTVEPMSIDMPIAPGTQVVIVDGSSLKGMHPGIKAEEVTEIIDHRIVDYVEGSFPHAHIQIEAVGAAATLIIERYMHAGLQIPHELGSLLFGAIVHNTLWLKSTNTTKRDAAALAPVAKTLSQPQKIAQQMFEYASDAMAKDPISLVRDGKQITLDGQQVSIYQYIVWDISTTEINELISLAVYANQQANGSAWSCIIITSIYHGKTLIFCADRKGQSILSDKLHVHFEEKYALLPHLALRKQVLEGLFRT
ncbi:MAG: DHH family phosphoesterase [Candidatus Roizmanbacteria bacterium]